MALNHFRAGHFKAQHFAVLGSLFDSQPALPDNGWRGAITVSSLSRITSRQSGAQALAASSLARRGYLVVGRHGVRIRK